MTTPTPKKVVLKGDGIYKEAALEALDIYGDGGITPGMLIERTATGTVQPHSTSTGLAAPKMWAVEDALFEGRDINTDYDEDGEVVRYFIAYPGAEIYALLRAGTGGDTIDKNHLLASNGDGTLIVSATNPVARTLEDVDNDPGTGGAAVRVKVEVL
jgi:hypothetical protein